MYEPFTWQLLLGSAPSRVFGSLVRAASEEGRVCGIEEYGTVLTYTPSQGEVDLNGQIRASVSACPEGTLVTITAADRGLVSSGALAVQASSVAALVHHLRVQYGEQNLLASA